MKGSVLMGTLLAAAAAMGIGLWYFTQIAHYKRIQGLTSITIGEKSHVVRDYQGLDGDSSPLKLRACFNLERPIKTPEPVQTRLTPLIAPRWFDCFDARQIAADLDNDIATALLANENEPFGFNRYIAYYPDGRAYMWRQINICGERYFDGKAMPADCPSPDAQTAAKRVMIDPKSDLFTLKLTSSQDKRLINMRIIGAPKIAAASSGRSFHACFQTPSDALLSAQEFIPITVANPPKPRGNFPCFNATKIQSDIVAGRASAFLGQHNIIPGFDRVIAVYADGTAYAWHQKGVK